MCASDCLPPWYPNGTKWSACASNVWRSTERERNRFIGNTQSQHADRPTDRQPTKNTLTSINMHLMCCTISFTKFYIRKLCFSSSYLFLFQFISATLPLSVASCCCQLFVNENLGKICQSHNCCICWTFTLSTNRGKRSELQAPNANRRWKTVTTEEKERDRVSQRDLEWHRY